MFVDVVVDAKGDPAKSTFTYRVPESLRGILAIGHLVTVPFGKKSACGWVTNLINKTDYVTKPVTALAYPDPVIDPVRLELARFMASYYCAPLGACIKTACLFKKVVRLKQDMSGHTRNRPTKTQAVDLTRSQQEAVRAIVARFNTPQTTLLRGVTGSGKTHVYIEVLRALFTKDPGAQAILLVPEIALTPQTVERLEEVFGNLVCVWHSRLSHGEMYAAFLRMRHHRPTIIIGSRSAIFAPLPNLSLIVIDEEHESSYKQTEMPRYHARTVAAWLSANLNIPLVLGSATPALETTYRAPITVLLPTRFGTRTLPRVEVVNMKEELRAGNTSIFSYKLEHYLSSVIERGEQAVLFLNRRGFARAILCRVCGLLVTCTSCAISLTLHKTMQIDTFRLLCHHCGEVRPVPTVCPRCQSHYLKSFGAGTQTIESELTKRFPNARILRMDRDTTSRKGAHQRSFDAFRNGAVDILVGTQMIAKGWDIPNVTLVGIVASDLSLALPDYTASERTFQLLVQVAGRAGRADKPGIVVLQTYNPDHPAITAAARHDYPGFYQKELHARKTFFYPPFVHLVLLSLHQKEEQSANKKAASLAQSLKQIAQNGSSPRNVQILGPAPALIPKRRGMYTYQIVIKSHSRAARAEILTHVPREWTIDVDPIHLS